MSVTDDTPEIPLIDLPPGTYRIRKRSMIWEFAQLKDGTVIIRVVAKEIAKEPETD